MLTREEGWLWREAGALGQSGCKKREGEERERETINSYSALRTVSPITQRIFNTWAIAHARYMPPPSCTSRSLTLTAHSFSSTLPSRLSRDCEHSVTVSYYHSKSNLVLKAGPATSCQAAGEKAPGAATKRPKALPRRCSQELREHRSTMAGCSCTGSFLSLCTKGTMPNSVIRLL